MPDIRDFFKPKPAEDKAASPQTPAAKSASPRKPAAPASTQKRSRVVDSEEEEAELDDVSVVAAATAAGAASVLAKTSHPVVVDKDSHLAESVSESGSEAEAEEAEWAKGAPVPYAELVAVFEFIEATTKRLEIQEAISRFFRRILVTTPQDLLPAVYLCCNAVTPAFEGVELGIGESLLKKAIVETTGCVTRIPLPSVVVA
jgi:DNA ligase-1